MVNCVWFRARSTHFADKVRAAAAADGAAIKVKAADKARGKVKPRATLERRRKVQIRTGKARSLGKDKAVKVVRDKAADAAVAAGASRINRHKSIAN